MLGISKVMTLSCTYDHRIIQGAESGMFLGRVQALLDGKDGFYEEVFNHLRMPHQPVRWETDRKPALPGMNAARYAEIAKEAGIMQMINAYRVRGHLIADLDPLGAEPSYHAELDPETYGLTIWDLDREFLTGSLGEAIGEGAPKAVATLREILETLRQTYCGKIGCEYMNIQVPEQKRWLQQRMEPEANNWPLDRETRMRILRSVMAGEEFEHFLHSRFVGQKRFALEGGETALAILEEILERAAAGNVHELVVGMAHRGRLNILANTVGKDVKQIFSEFEGDIDPSSTQGSGDVKYHLGATGVRKTSSGREIVVSVSPNPSHLEAVDPVVEGIVRPKQDRLGDTARERVIPVLIHGDAAFAGQGVVAETLNLSQLDGYSTGGTIHLIINNQIGFTTLPDESRSTPYSTDIARGVQAPIFHVNGDDPDAAIRVVQIAFDYRQQFKKDVVIDMICYRRHGHNEGDDPSYTQPILYRKIKEHPSVAVLYQQRLVREGVATDAGVRWDPQGAGGAPLGRLRRRAGARRALRTPGTQRGPRRGDRRLLPADRRQPAGAGARDPRHHPVPRKLSPASQTARLHRQAPRGNRQGRQSRLGLRRSAGLRHAGARRHGGAPQRPGFRPRHLQPAPSGVLRFRDRQALRAHAAHLARSGALRRVRQLAQRVRRAGLRVRLQRGRAAGAGDLGSAVRRFRQRRADHDRPVHLLLRAEVGTAQRPGDAAAPRLRRAGPRNTPARASSATSRCARKTTCRCATAPRRRNTSTCCGARCTAGATGAARASR